MTGGAKYYCRTTLSRITDTKKVFSEQTQTRPTPDNSDGRSERGKSGGRGGR
jgi:hypothetical protein